jgi:hypothetical protein
MVVPRLQHQPAHDSKPVGNQSKLNLPWSQQVLDPEPAAQQTCSRISSWNPAALYTSLFHG